LPPPARSGLTGKRLLTYNAVECYGCGASRCFSCHRRSDTAAVDRPPGDRGAPGQGAGGTVRRVAAGDFPTPGGAPAGGAGERAAGRARAPLCPGAGTVARGTRLAGNVRAFLVTETRCAGSSSRRRVTSFELECANRPGQAVGRASAIHVCSLKLGARSSRSDRPWKSRGT